MNRPIRDRQKSTSSSVDTNGPARRHSTRKQTGRPINTEAGTNQPGQARRSPTGSTRRLVGECRHHPIPPARTRGGGWSGRATPRASSAPRPTERPPDSCRVRSRDTRRVFSRSSQTALVRGGGPASAATAFTPGGTPSPSFVYARPTRTGSDPRGIDQQSAAGRSRTSSGVDDAIFASGSCGDFHSLFDVFLFFRDRSNRARSACVGVSTPDASANRRMNAS